MKLRGKPADHAISLVDKPTSVYTLEQIDNTFGIYANKTERLPWRYRR
jgi:hypothetical protein